MTVTLTNLLTVAIALTFECSKVSRAVLFLQTNTFQCVVAVGSNQTYVIYLYADGLMEWFEKEDSGAGYKYDNTTFFLNDTRMVPFTSNIGCPGVWVLRVDREELVLPDSGNDYFQTPMQNFTTIIAIVAEICDSTNASKYPAQCFNMSVHVSEPSFECAHR